MRPAAIRKSDIAVRGLTEASIAQTVTKSGALSTMVELSDALAPGLKLRVAGGAAKWSVTTSDLDGNRIRIPLGTWPRVDLDRAREAADTLRRQLRDLGDDRVEILTVRRLVALYDARKLKQLKRGATALSAIKAGLRSVMDAEAASVTRNNIRDAIDDIADRAPIQANRTLVYIKAMYSWAVGRGYVETNPAASLSKPAREVARDRSPELDELADIWCAAATLGYPFGDAIRVLMLTATRREEVAAIRVQELDFQEDGTVIWTLPAARSKNGRAIRSAFPSAVSEILQRAIEKRPEGSSLVFSTTGKTPISGWSKAKGRIDDAIDTADSKGGIQDARVPWRLHDFRRSFATLASDRLKIDRAVADRCLNHVGASTTSTISRVYARSEMYDQRRDALQAWADELMTAVNAATAKTAPPNEDVCDA